MTFVLYIRNLTVWKAHYFMEYFIATIDLIIPHIYIEFMMKNNTSYCIATANTNATTSLTPSILYFWP